MKPRQFRFSKNALIAAGMLSFILPAQSGQLSIAPEPLGTAISTIQPNIMFILDDSGSMASAYMPDYVNDSHNAPTTTAACVDAGDSSDGGGTGRIDGPPDACVFGDPPFNSPDLNTIYYNPGIFYRPGANPDGSDRQSQNAANTATYTAVQLNPYVSALTVNLAAGYLDRVWCTAQGDVATGGTCRQNTAYRYPDAVFPYGTTSGGGVKYVAGAPYYYRMQTAQFCDSAARTNCRSGSAATAGVYTFLAPEFCTDPELTTCAAGSAVTAAHVFSGVRWCSDAGTLLSCQRKKIGSFIHAKHLGTTATQTGTFAAVSNEGNITVTSVNAAGGTINNIAIAGVDVISGSITVAPGSTASTVAGQIVSAINGHVSSPDFVAAQSGANVTVTQAVAGAAGAGAAIVVTTTQIGTQSSIGRLTVNTGPNSVAQEIVTLTVNGVNLLCPIAADNSSYGFGVSVKAPDGRIQATSGTNSTAERSAFRAALRDRINACAVNGFQATISGSDVRIIAPVSQGAGPNGQPVARTGVGSLTNFVVGNMGSVQLGASSPTVATTPSNMTGGQDAFSGTRTVRIGYGSFSRSDIVPSNNSYPKSAARIDCAGSTCTYDEEMTNFANWFAYYLTRMQLMKTAVGRAFVSVDDTYRVGFITINPGDPVSASRYLKISDFIPGAGSHKEAWYNKLYAQTPSGSTPLREALARVGWIFAGKMNTGLTSGIPNADDPVIMSCQPNFAILSTDGYWNGNEGQELDGTLMRNYDNDESPTRFTFPYVSRAAGTYDGNLLPTTTAGSSPGGQGTLADVAMYYYATDLRQPPSAMEKDNVPRTNKDANEKQHMVTFTLGLGLDGTLSYRSDYESADSGDFFNIKQGTTNWPAPQENAPTALDDLWHTAVNGRGTFFSAKNPDDLSNGLSDTLNQLTARVGAGAAAATSNLQPVAGDNFAFTAQYQTSDWIGDLKARTIDLSTGRVSNVELWSAAALLDSTPYTSRKLFTYDPADTAGNQLKHLCWPGDTGTNCSDGAGLDATEQAYFDTSPLAQYASWTAAQKTAATAQSLVNYLRGDTSYEDSGRSLTTDLYRDRLSLLGDIINAQPAYVRKSPFSYSDPGYSGFKACTSGAGGGCDTTQFPDPSKPRRGTVYAASNDGMLHAFETDVNNDPYFQTAGVSTDATLDDAFTGNNTGNGVERWAYIPRIVLPSLHKLANKPYSHRYLVDGSPQVGDICVSTPCAGQSDWRTILVAGLNSGGAGYYALDVTNPLAPKALWEFTHGACGSPAADCHVGLSYGNPIITKRNSDGKWVVIVTSGYNNNVGGGDGVGYLYVLDAATGVILNRIATGVGTVSSPSGLGRINGWAPNSLENNITLAVYGGDLEGNLWRFQLDSTAAGYLTATKVAVAKDSLGNTQPITVRPELGEVEGKRIVLFGTGKFLENVDKVGPFTTQTIYGLRDDLAVVTGPVVSDVRNATLVKVRQFVPGKISGTRTVTSSTSLQINWATEFGWLIDLPDSGERVNVDPQLQLGTLVVASNVPSGDTCGSGSSFINFLDYATGSYIPGATNDMASQKMSSSVTVGLNVVMLPGGKVVTIVTTADNKQLTENTPVPTDPFSGRRVSWRELIVDQ